MRRLFGADSLRSDNRCSLGTPPHCGASGPTRPRRLVGACVSEFENMERKRAHKRRVLAPVMR